MLNTNYSVRHPQFQGKSGSLVLPEVITAKERRSVGKHDLTEHELFYRQVNAMVTKDALKADANSMKVFDWNPVTLLGNLVSRRKTRTVANAFESIQDACDKEFWDREQAEGRVARSSTGKLAGHGKRPTRSSK